MYKSQLTNVSWQITNIVSIYFHLLKKIQQVSTPDVISLVIPYTPRKFYFKVNKLTSVFYASVLLLIMNFVITLSADYFDNVMTKFMINNRTNAFKTDINLFFTITNCRIAG